MRHPLWTAALVCAASAAVPALHAQPAQAPQPAAQPSPGGSAAETPAFKQEELDQMLAPIALYPDDLITQILMATTYPLEIVQADRWVKANESLKGDAAARALEAQQWDASVKSLVNFPDILSMLSEKLDWTKKVGDAFIGQQQQVMATIQSLRAKAKETGALESNEHQNVQVQQEGGTQTIVIEPSDPDIIYVPAYNPTVVYGAWPYPAYPPYPYHPPNYYPAATAALSFGVGVAAGYAWGYAWGHSDWGHGDVDIDVNRNYNRNTNINRDNFRSNTGQTWRHDAGHRGSVPYRNQAAAQRYGGQSAAQAAQARESFRGYSGSSRIDRSAAGGIQRSPSTALGAGGGGGAGAQRQAAGSRTAAGGSALSGIDRGGSAAAMQSQRGRSSMGGASYSGGTRSAGSAPRSSPSRSSAGAARAGGGARGGGGRGGGGRR